MFSLFRSPLIPACLIIFGIFLIYAGHKNSGEFSALRDHGKTVQAGIENLKWKERNGQGGLDSSYSAIVEFTTEDGQKIKEEIHVTTELGRSLRDKSSPPVMTVHYLPESPTTFRDVRDEDSSDAQSGVGRYMLLAGIVILIFRFFFTGRKTKGRGVPR